MSSKVTRVARKRQFIQSAFFPIGPEICNAMGLTPTSDDVEAHSQRAEQERRALLTGSDRFGDVINMAHWYVEAAQAVDDNGFPLTRGPAEHMVSFFIAAYTIMEGI